MFINFAIQGLNDYFATATIRCTPRAPTPRSPCATRAPGSAAGRAAWRTAPATATRSRCEAHRRYRIKQMWAMNGGLLDLLAHDCPDELAQMHQDMTAGLLEPVVAGFGAHRLPYYTADTNCDAITAGAEAMQQMLGAAPGLVYYPDSRIVTGTPNVSDALRRAQVRYLVVDAGESRDGAAAAGHPAGRRRPAAEPGDRRPLGELAVPVAGPDLRHPGAVHRPGDEGRAVRGARPGGRPGQGVAGHPTQVHRAGRAARAAPRQPARVQRRRRQGQR